MLLINNYFEFVCQTKCAINLFIPCIFCIRFFRIMLMVEGDMNGKNKP